MTPFVMGYLIIFFSDRSKIGRSTDELNKVVPVHPIMVFPIDQVTTSVQTSGFNEVNHTRGSAAASEPHFDTLPTLESR